MKVPMAAPLVTGVGRSCGSTVGTVENHAVVVNEICVVVCNVFAATLCLEIRKVKTALNFIKWPYKGRLGQTVSVVEGKVLQNLKFQMMEINNV